MNKFKTTIIILFLPVILIAGEVKIEVSQKNYPVLKLKDKNQIYRVKIVTDTFDILNSMKFSLRGTEYYKDIESLALYYNWSDSLFRKRETFVSKVDKISGKVVFKKNMTLLKGANYFWVSCKLKENANIDNHISIKLREVSVNKKRIKNYSSIGSFTKLKMGIALRKHNDEGVDTYRIPGLATSNQGTLLAVYDVRRHSGADLQGDIDVGLNRSTDGGKTWESMQIIMDMGEFGGLPNDQNGIGDPSILVDKTTGTIWVAAVWQNGIPFKRNWWGSKPGMGYETSQFVLVKSDDDGKTWSKPINITHQIKKPEWHLLLQGPGKGITMKNGTIVFPAQYKDKNKVPHSTLIYSKDHGKTWNIGTGVKPETTEAQLIELENGDIMINCRNNHARNKNGVGRVVATTSNLGETWKYHSTNEKVLEESTCMASLDKNIYGKSGKIVLFSNPNTHRGRHHMTVKLSKDDATSWPEKYWFLIDEGHGRGYSCISKIDDDTFGILYEGSGADLIFQRIKINDLLN